MITTEFLANPDLVKSWNEASKSEIVKLVRQTMDESSPVYQDFPELAKETADARYWFLRGYAYYHKKLQELATAIPVPQTIKSTYPPRQ